MSKQTTYTGDSFTNDPFDYLPSGLRSQFLREGHNTTKEVYRKGYTPNKTGTSGYLKQSKGGYTAGMGGKANRGGIGKVSGPTGTKSDNRTMETHSGPMAEGSGNKSRRYKLSSFAKGRNKGGGSENASRGRTGVARVSRANSNSVRDNTSPSGSRKDGHTGSKSADYKLGGSGTGTLGVSGRMPPNDAHLNPLTGNQNPNSYRGLGMGHN